MGWSWETGVGVCADRIFLNELSRSLVAKTGLEEWRLFSDGCDIRRIVFPPSTILCGIRRVSVNGRDGSNVVAKRLNLRMPSFHTRTLDV